MEKYNFIFIFTFGFITGLSINNITEYTSNMDNERDTKIVSTHIETDYTEYSSVDIVDNLDIVAESLILHIRESDVVHANIIDGYYKLAIQEQKKYGFPASVKLAQMIVEGGYSASNPYGSKLAIDAKNPFGIKYFGNGVPTRIQKWDELAYANEWVSYMDDCNGQKCKFIKFKGMWHAFRFHSEFMVGSAEAPSHYSTFVTTGDWKDWINALMKGKYATNKNYDKQLIHIIEKYKLYKFDQFGVAV